MNRGVFLSVVIPTHNRRGLVTRAIQSVLDQDALGRVQVIVVDDGSTDGTGELLGARYGADARFELLSSPRRHASAARNLGFGSARGEFVCFLDSDDYWLDGTLATIAHVFATHPELAFVSIDGSTLATPGHAPLSRIVAGDSPGWSHAGFRSVRLQSASITLPDGSRSARLLRGDFFPAIINGDLFYLSGLVIRRECVARAGGFHERFRYFNDWEFFARMCLEGPGAYLQYDGFRRDTGRADQISRRRPATAIARRHVFIVRSLLRRDEPRMSVYANALRTALVDAQYQMARALAASAHAGWARRYLYRCIRRLHKTGRCLVLLAGWLPRGARAPRRAETVPR
jgi:glycosyltransferase involved in cell wall biosynthesis